MRDPPPHRLPFVLGSGIERTTSAARAQKWQQAYGVGPQKEFHVRDAGSALLKTLGIGSAVVILALGAGAVYGDLTDGGLQCESGVRSNMIGEPDLSAITAKSPAEALEDTIAGDGAGIVGLHGVTGSASELAARFELVPAAKDEVSEGGQVFEYTDEAGTVVARVQVEPTGDGRYFVGSAQSCVRTK